MKPKQNYKPGVLDNCQTPEYALEPLLPYLNSDWHIWECAAGERYLLDALRSKGYSVVGTDILDYFSTDFLVDSPKFIFDCIVTNPPYGLKYLWIERCYELGKPFALLMPVETLGAKTAQVQFAKHGIQVIFMNQRVDFKMPNKGFTGSAQFPTAWFTWGLNAPPMSFVALNKPKKEKVNVT